LATHHLRRWVVWLGTPESQQPRPGRRSLPQPRSERTIHTYTRSAHAFAKWLVVERYMDVDVTEHFTLPKVGKPLIKILEEEDFAALLAACREGQYPQEYVLRNQALLWVLYDTGMRLAGLAKLQMNQLDLRTGLTIAHGKGDKERRIALGANALAALRRYLHQGRPRLAGERPCERVFLGADGQLTPRGVQEVLRRLRRRCGFSDRRVSAHTFGTPLRCAT
jgi:site-specific recombinase XerD